jgi:hypothetical protein
VGTAIHRFFAIRSPDDAQDAKPEFYLIPHTHSSAVKQQQQQQEDQQLHQKLIELDSVSGVLSVAARLEDHMSRRNKG